VSELDRVHVAGESPYDVVVGRGVLGEVATMLDSRVRKVALIHPASVQGVAERVAASLGGGESHLIEVPGGEAAKTVQVAAEIWDRLGELAFTRTDAIVGVGGGATTDLAGFVAATWLRGVPVVHAPTTLLGMVDAAVGGKTAINISSGKNLVGSFHPPAGVVCDLDTLATMPSADYVAGLAEIAKAGFIADPVILELLESDPQAATTPNGPHTRELITRAIDVKASVVGADLHEQGLREILNYGHTLGHAIEKAEGYRWRHGDAVSVGMVFAATLGRLSGRLDEEPAKRHGALLKALGLPVTYRGAPWAELADAMRRDKKARGDRLRFVLLEGIARPVVVDDLDSGLLEAAFAEVTE
jgi:3-dehydroquinate synthase